MKIANSAKKSSIYVLLAFSFILFYPFSSTHAHQTSHDDTEMEVSQKKMRITGVVRDENGNAVPGASIIVAMTVLSLP